MVKKNINKVAVAMLFLLVVGLTGFSIALVEWNHRYLDRYQALEQMTGQMEKLESRLAVNRLKLANYDFMEYKNNAFTKRYPVYSSILSSVYDKSEEFGFKPDLVLGVIKVESNFQPTAVSYAGAYGLMQINLSVWKNELNIDQSRIFEVDYNIDLGLKILKHYYVESRGNMKRALHLYNNGYLYNNTKYVGKVDSAVLSLSPDNHNLKGLGY